MRAYRRLATTVRSMLSTMSRSTGLPDIRIKARLAASQGFGGVLGFGCPRHPGGRAPHELQHAGERFRGIAPIVHDQRANRGMVLGRHLNRKIGSRIQSSVMVCQETFAARSCRRRTARSLLMQRAKASEYRSSISSRVIIPRDCASVKYPSAPSQARAS
jgi:hypothetical protein